MATWSLHALIWLLVQYLDSFTLYIFFQLRILLLHHLYLKQVLLYLCILSSDSSHQSAKHSGNNRRQHHIPDIKWRSKNWTCPQTDIYFVLHCFRASGCNMFTAVPHRLAGSNRSWVSNGVNTLCHRNIVCLCSTSTKNRWSDGPTYFANERAGDWHSCSEDACVGGKLPWKGWRS